MKNENNETIQNKVNKICLNSPSWLNVLKKWTFDLNPQDWFIKPKLDNHLKEYFPDENNFRKILTQTLKGMKVNYTINIMCKNEEVVQYSVNLKANETMNTSLRNEKNKVNTIQVLTDIHLDGLVVEDWLSSKLVKWFDKNFNNPRFQLQYNDDSTTLKLIDNNFIIE